MNLTLMKDAISVRKLTRKPERRVFYVDVQNLAPDKAEAFVERLKDQFKKKQTTTTVWTKEELLNYMMRLIGGPNKKVSKSVVNQIKRTITEDFRRNHGSDDESGMRISSAVVSMIEYDLNGMAILKHD